MITADARLFSSFAGLSATVSVIGETNGTPAVLASSGPGLVRLITNTMLPAGTRVLVTVRRATITGTVVFCSESGPEYAIGVHFGNGGDPRREPRLPLRWDALLFTFDQTVKDLPVEVIDISAHGLGIRSPARIWAGSSVALELPVGLVFGEIRYCKGVENSYRLGVLLHDVLQYEKPSANEGWYRRLFNRGRTQAS